MLKKIYNHMKNFIVKNYKVLLPVILIIIATIITICLINNYKELRPFIDKIELGNYDIDINNPNTFFRTKLDIYECVIESNININKVGKYKYKLTCPQKTYGPYKIKVVDTTAPETIIKKLVIKPGSKLEAKDLFLYINDLSGYHIKYLNEFSTDSEGMHDVDMMVTDKYGNSKEVIAVLTVSESLSVKTILCDNLNKVGSVPSNYYVYLDKDDNIYNILRVTEFKYDDARYYNEDLAHYKQKKLISGIDGEAAIDKKNMNITIYKYILDIDYKDEFNIKYQPKNKNDIYKVFNSSCRDI